MLARVVCNVRQNDASVQNVAVCRMRQKDAVIKVRTKKMRRDIKGEGRGAVGGQGLIIYQLRDDGSGRMADNTLSLRIGCKRYRFATVGGVCGIDSCGGVELCGAGDAVNFGNIVGVNPGTGHDDDAGVCARNQIGNKIGPAFGRHLLARGEQAVAAQVNNLLERYVGGVADVEGAVKGNGQVAGGCNHLAASVHINITRGCKCADDYAVYPGLTAKLDIPAHGFYLCRRVAKTAVASANQHVDVETELGGQYALNCAVARCNTATGNGRAKLYSDGATGGCFSCFVERGTTNFYLSHAMV